MRYRASVPAVVKALRSWHEPVRAAAIESLGWFGDANAALLIQGLNDRAASVRRAAVEAVQRTSSREATEHLRTLVSSEADPVVREMMHQALAALQGGAD